MNGEQGPFHPIVITCLRVTMNNTLAVVRNDKAMAIAAPDGRVGGGSLGTHSRRDGGENVTRTNPAFLPLTAGKVSASRLERRSELCVRMINVRGHVHRCPTTAELHMLGPYSGLKRAA